MIGCFSWQNAKIFAHRAHPSRRWWMNCDKNYNSMDDGSIIWPCRSDVSSQSTGSITQLLGSPNQKSHSVSSRWIWAYHIMRSDTRSHCRHWSEQRSILYNQYLFLTNDRLAFCISQAVNIKGDSIMISFVRGKLEWYAIGDGQYETNGRGHICLKRDRKRLSFFSTCIRQRLTVKQRYSGDVAQYVNVADEVSFHPSYIIKNDLLQIENFTRWTRLSVASSGNRLPPGELSKKMVMSSFLVSKQISDARAQAALISLFQRYIADCSPFIKHTFEQVQRDKNRKFHEKQI